jgi:hypothetical protein
MTITEFLSHIKHPEATDAGDTIKLKDVAERFPYCTSAQILLAYRLFKENDLDFQSRLKKVAAYAASRKKLKQLFDGFQISGDTITELPGSDASFDPVIADKQEYGGMKSEEELLAIVRQRLEEIKLEREEKTGSEIQKKILERTDQDAKNLSKKELVEKFIHDKPRLSSPKATFFSPSEKAVKSNLDDDEIVTETLAQLFYKQGNISKAIRIYDKLILLFPEKSSYFAAQIEKMNTSQASSSKEEAG